MATKSIRLSNGTDTLLPESATSANGYCKMADGTLIQWGTETMTANASVYTITFPQAFVNNFYGLSVVGNYVDTIKAWAYASGGNNSIKVYPSVPSSSEQPFRWMVVGRWK